MNFHMDYYSVNMTKHSHLSSHHRRHHGVIADAERKIFARNTIIWSLSKDKTARFDPRYNIYISTTCHQIFQSLWDRTHSESIPLLNPSSNTFTSKFIDAHAERKGVTPRSSLYQGRRKIRVSHARSKHEKVDTLIQYR
jgi:5'(3')-deoxyribonucleotidase